MFYILYKLYQLISIIKKFSNVYDSTYIIDDDYCLNLKDSILNSGCIGIKFSQWILSKMRSEQGINCKFVVDYFEDLFDDCPKHKFEYSKKIFKKTFKLNIGELIDENSIKLIASGSIGQIYKAKLLIPHKVNRVIKKEGKIDYQNYDIKYVAIKIKHPNVDSEASTYNKIFNFLSYLQKWNSLKNKFHLHFNFDDFINNILEQIDLNNEMFNSNIFIKNFENNNCIYIPKVIYSSKNILVSEYINGVDFETLTDYNQLKVSLNYIGLINKMCIIDNFVHGDLHHKNWKPLPVFNSKKNNYDYKIILYDLGICFKSHDKEFAKDLFEVFEIGDIDNLGKTLIRGIIKPPNCTFTSEDIKEILVSAIDNFKKKSLDVINITNNLDITLSKHNLKLADITLNLSIMFTLVDHTLKKQNIVGGNVEPNHYYNILKAKQLDLISYCNVNNSYQDLVVYLEDKIDRHSKLHKDDLEIFIKRSQNSYLSLESPSDIESDEEEENGEI